MVCRPQCADPAPAGGALARRDGARQGIARQSIGARGAGAHRGSQSLNAMLLYLTEYLAKSYSGFHVFQYLTLRGILAALTTLTMALAIGPRMIATLTRYQ